MFNSIVSRSIYILHAWTIEILGGGWRGAKELCPTSYDTVSGSNFCDYSREASVAKL